MDETLESENFAQIGNESETRKMMNPRVEIDTSPPFGSVKEAVTRFGGSGSWIPLHVLRLAGHDLEEFDMDKVEKQAAELEKELIIKEQETLDILRELESAKGVMEGLKLNLMKEVSAIMSSLDSNPDPGTLTPVNKSTASLTLCQVPSPPGIILTELKEAKSNLTKTTNDLAMIRSSVESLNKKMRTHKANLGEKDVETKRVIQESIETRELTFWKMEEAAQNEVIKATSEIERTKMSIKMVEMRLIAAKKMEEAARAMEAVARAESNGDKPSVHEGVTLSYEEYCALAQKAQKNQDFSMKNGGRKDANLSTMMFLKNLDERNSDFSCVKTTLEEALGPRTNAPNQQNLESRNGFLRERSSNTQPTKPTHNHPKARSSNPFRGHSPRPFGPLSGPDSNLTNTESRPVLRSSVSIGDILSRKLILQDNIVVREDVQSQTQTQRDNASLNHMLREQSGLIFHESQKADKEGRVNKQFFAQRKKFGFIHVSLPLKQSKKKSNSKPDQLLN